MLKKLRKVLRKWLGVDDVASDLRLIRVLFEETKKNTDKLVNEAIIGADLAYRDESAIAIVHYSRATNSFKVISDTNCKFDSYHSFIQTMRRLVRQHNVTYIALDTPAETPDLKARILPDKKLLDMFEERL